jgi:hypothetical protein
MMRRNDVEEDEGRGRWVQNKRENLFSKENLFAVYFSIMSLSLDFKYCTWIEVEF